MSLAKIFSISTRVRATNAGATVVRHAQYSTPSEKTEKVYPPTKPGYIYVNAEDPEMTFKEMSNRAAQTLFWTELARGFAVTLAHIFKLPSRTIAQVPWYITYSEIHKNLEIKTVNEEILTMAAKYQYQ